MLMQFKILKFWKMQGYGYMSQVRGRCGEKRGRRKSSSASLARQLSVFLNTPREKCVELYNTTLPWPCSWLKLVYWVRPFLPLHKIMSLYLAQFINLAFKTKLTRDYIFTTCFAIVSPKIIIIMQIFNDT